MLFLWIFGNSINYKLGHFGYLGFFFLAALLSGLAHYGISGGPVVGASGAIMGVMGAFLLFFPRNNITVFVWVFRPSICRVSSGWILLAYVLWDALTIYLDATGNVAVWAHIGGFIAGLSIAVLCLLLGWVRTSQDEQSLLHVLKIRTDVN